MRDFPQPPDLGSQRLGDTFVPLGVLVHARLRDDIASGHFKPGERLKERQLADRYGVSRIPVRDALLKLEREGFLDTLPRRGVVVRTLTAEDMQDLYDVREALEGQIMRLAARRATPTDKENLQKLIVRARDALGSGDDSALRSANFELHQLIIECAHNPLIGTLMEPLEARMFWILRRGSDPEKRHVEHVGMVDAICSGDEILASRLAFEHVHNSYLSAMELVDAGWLNRSPTATPPLGTSDWDQRPEAVKNTGLRQ